MFVRRAISRAMSSGANKMSTPYVKPIDVSAKKVNNIKEMSISHDEPINYSTSKAKLYDSVSTFIPGKKKRLLWEAPIHQASVIWCSIIGLMVYFAFYRETNEWDENFEKQFYQGFPELEEIDLKRKIKRKQSRGEDCSIEMFRLRQILRLRQN